MMFFAFKDFLMNHTVEIFSLTIIIILVSVVWAQSKQIDMQNEKLKASMSEEFSEKIINQTKEILKTSGDVKAVKFLRENTGMSLLEAKKRIDTLK